MKKRRWVEEFHEEHGHMPVQELDVYPEDLGKRRPGIRLTDKHRGLNNTGRLLLAMAVGGRSKWTRDSLEGLDLKTDGGKPLVLEKYAYQLQRGALVREDEGVFEVTERGWRVFESGVLG